VSEIVWREWGPPLRVAIERSPVWVFARAVKDDNPVYASAEAASAAGFGSIPCPPTYTFVMRDAGAWPDLQPGPPGAGPAADSRDVGYTNRPGLYLHGEQEFVYHRTPMVGDTLEGRTRVSEPVWREGGRRMELTWYQTVWSDLDGTPVVTEQITSLYLPDG
jgi:N-terminal half of MaoC dehydratase